jgi:cell division septation protein DedD/nucleoid DNA-binding protein
MVEEHIKHLLHDHDCVIIPDFGGLITHYASARIHPVKHTFVPPSRRIAFNEKLKLNDGLLISTIARRDQLPVESAKKKVADFVLGMQEELRAKYKFEMRGIGLFRLNAEQKIEFEYIETDNLLDESFGLPELVSRPVLATPPVTMRNLFKDQPAAASVAAGKKPVRSRLTRLYKVAAAVVIGSLTFSGLYYLSSQSDSSLSSLNPLPYFISELPQTRATGAEGAGTIVSPFEDQKSDEEIKDMYREFYPAGLADQLLMSKYAEEAVAGISDWDEYVDNLDDAPAPGENALSPEGLEPTDWALANSSPAAEPPVAKVEVREEAKSATPVAKAETPKPSAAPAKAAAAPKTETATAVISAPKSRFFIIVGGFSDLESAEKSRTALQKQGRDAKIILPTNGSKLHRVSVADFKDREAAVQIIGEMRTTYGSGTWILHY